MNEINNKQPLNKIEKLARYTTRKSILIKRSEEEMKLELN